LKRAPEFDNWLVHAGLADASFRLAGNGGLLPDFASRLLGERATKV
jgi:ethanolamine ammonia-lyase large subunit